MTFEQTSPNETNWQQQAKQHLFQGEYVQVAHLYEQAITAEPEIKSHYWHLGLMLLLQGQEAEAQMTWMLGMSEGKPEQIEQWTTELIQVLQIEAERQEVLENYQNAWLIRQHIREIAPADVNNLLYIIALSIELETFTSETLTTSGITKLLKAKELAVDIDLLLQVLQKILNFVDEEPVFLTFIEACLHCTYKSHVFIDMVLNTSSKLASTAPRRPALAARLAETCLNQEPNYRQVLHHLAIFYQDSHQFAKGIDVAKQYYESAKSLVDKIYGNYLVIRGLMSATGHWKEVSLALEQQRQLILSLTQGLQTIIELDDTFRLFNSAFFFPYFKDDLPDNRHIINQISCFCFGNFENQAKPIIEEYRYSLTANLTKTTANKVIKVGYISHFLRKHSVGWLTRWLFQHHNRQEFQIYSYLVSYSSIDNFIQQWFVSNSERAYKFESISTEILEQIYQDEIDILIDLDSLTFPPMYEILSTKPAPIQVTWLGWDASGLPSIDYFVADPYVLPESAQDYYTEKIWRLPNAYVAVDGFEVGVPNLRRYQLDIPSHAVIYLVAQNGYKRHLDNVRLQMRIIKEVPNSYLLIKGVADAESSKTFFLEVAEEVGVCGDRLRFLPRTPSEEVHRANLSIADVVLDTYPYNGATTTLETLWMGVPLVTRVGQQFAARNSYTFMMNVGVTEGIAWTDEAYVEWGVRLGKDPEMRQQISWKLRQSRQTSPLWNAKQFTREMEKAYKQMWQIYIQA